MSKCKDCQAEILWLEMPSGKKMPVEAEAIISTGKETIVTTTEQVIREEDNKRVYKALQIYVKAPKGLVGHVPHFANCTRKKKRTPAELPDGPTETEATFWWQLIGEDWISIYCSDTEIGHIQIYHPSIKWWIENIVNELEVKTNSGKAKFLQSQQEMKFTQGK